MAHHIQIELVYPRLVQDDVREFRETVLDILNDSSPADPSGLILFGRPEGGFVDPIGDVYKRQTASCSRRRTRGSHQLGYRTIAATSASATSRFFFLAFMMSGHFI